MKFYRSIYILFLLTFAVARLGFSNDTISGLIRVGNGMPYTSLTKSDGVFNKLNNSILGGDLVIIIYSDLSEDGTIQLNQLTETLPGNYTIKIIPCDTATTMKKITAAYNTATSGFIRFNGADRVTIDGKHNQMEHFLWFVNLNNAQGGVFSFRNGATFDTIRNCLIQAGSTATVHAIRFDNTTVPGGNSFNAIINNAIGDNSSLSNALLDYAIVSVSSGDTSTFNRNNTIQDNQISNFKTGAIKINSGLNFRLINNSFFYNAAVSYTYQVAVIEISGGRGHKIEGNFIGGKGPHCSGNPWIMNNAGFLGIRVLGTIPGTPITINNNTFQNLNITGTQIHWIIYLTGEVYADSIAGNIIGHPTDSASILFPSIAHFVGIKLDYSAGMVNHITGNTIANIVSLGTSCGTSFSGIKIENTANQPDTLDISHNRIYRFYSSMSCTSTNTDPIFNAIDDRSALTLKKFSNNTIHDLWKIGNGVANDAVSAIFLKNSVAAGKIEKNQIYGLFSTVNGSSLTGIQTGGGNWVIQNNFITLANNNLQNPLTIYGIRLKNNTGNLINITVNGNSILLDGNSNNINDKSYCFNSTVTGSFTGGNNILVNKRNGQGKNYIYSLTSMFSISADYNCVFSANNHFAEVNFQDYSDYNAWHALNGQDSHSLVYNPSFMDTQFGDLHLTMPVDSVLLNKGIPLYDLTDDIDGESRIDTVPCMGADEVVVKNICGCVRYDNQDSTTLSNCQVILLKANDQAIDSVLTDTLGLFCFHHVISGEYSLRFSFSQPWGGGNSTDALTILKQFAGQISLTGLRVKAADVNDDSHVNAIDALMVMRRFSGLMGGFPLADWIYEVPVIIMSNQDITVNIHAICAGDTNASYTP